MTLCHNNDQTRFSGTLTSARPLGIVKTTSPSGPANVNKCIEKVKGHHAQLEKVPTSWCYIENPCVIYLNPLYTSDSYICTLGNSEDQDEMLQFTPFAFREKHSILFGIYNL